MVEQGHPMITTARPLAAANKWPSWTGQRTLRVPLTLVCTKERWSLGCLGCLGSLGLGSHRIRRSKSLRSRRTSLDEVDEAIASLLKQRAVVRKSERVPVRSLQVGQRLTGIIREIGPCGLFVDVGAQRDGLVPISLVSAGYVADIYEEYMPGQKVTTWVAQIKQNGELSLTMQPMSARKSQGMHAEDLSAFQDVSEKEWFTGTLLRITEMGLFVEVQKPGATEGRVTGLVPMSETGRLRKDELEVGRELRVRLLQTEWLHSRSNKLYFSMRPSGAKPPVQAKSAEIRPLQQDADTADASLPIPKGTWLRGVVKRTTISGAVLSVRHPSSKQSMTAFVHISRMAQEEIEDPAQVVEVGEEVDVRLLELNAKLGHFEASMVA